MLQFEGLDVKKNSNVFFLKHTDLDKEHVRFSENCFFKQVSEAIM